MPADDDHEPPMEWSAAPREFFAETVRGVLAPLMPNAREPVAGQDDTLYDPRQMRFVIRYGDASEEVATHWSLPIAIATLLAFGEHARLYRFGDREPGIVIMEVMFWELGRAAVLLSSRCLEEAEKIVGSYGFGDEEG